MFPLLQQLGERLRESSEPRSHAKEPFDVAGTRGYRHIADDCGFFGARLDTMFCNHVAKVFQLSPNELAFLHVESQISSS